MDTDKFPQMSQNLTSLYYKTLCESAHQDILIDFKKPFPDQTIMSIDFKEIIQISFTFKRKPNGDEKILKTLIDVFPPEMEEEMGTLQELIKQMYRDSSKLVAVLDHLRYVFLKYKRI